MLLQTETLHSVNHLHMAADQAALFNDLPAVRGAMPQRILDSIEQLQGDIGRLGSKVAIR